MLVDLFKLSQNQVEDIPDLWCPQERTFEHLLQ